MRREVLKELKNSKELKPCPFCGSKAKLDVCRHSGKQYDFAVIRCEKCSATIKYGIDVEYCAVDRCVDEWNSRDTN